MKKHTFYVKGMHCASCEVLIENKLKELKNIKSVSASTAKGEVTIEYFGKKPQAKTLSSLFKKDGYSFFDEREKRGFNFNEFLTVIAVSLSIIALFLVFNHFGLSGLVNVNQTSSLPVFFLFGVMAGLSSCSALVGGIVLSQTKKWSEMYSTKDSFWQRLQPNLLFNSGRLIGFFVFGALLGLVGTKLRFSPAVGAGLVIFISLAMIVYGLQMMGFSMFQRFQLRIPRAITGFINGQQNLFGRFLPFFIGALTFFVPCGFTANAQSLSLLSGNPIQGGLIMLFFALGTLPMLFLIGLTGIELAHHQKLSNIFFKVAGVIVLFFAFYNINAQLNVLGIKNLSDLRLNFNFAKEKSDLQNGLAPMIDGKQVIRMIATARGYFPNYFRVKAGVPVRFEIEDRGASGCTNAVVANGLFDGEIVLTPGQIATKEFTPLYPGQYKFSCWMGMVSGVIEVVD